MISFQTANGEYVLLARRGGSLSEDALLYFARAAESGAEFLYADEAVIGEDGRQTNVYKPDDSPETLLSVPYIGSPIAVKKRLMAALEPPWDESAEALADFALRARERAGEAVHIGKVLFTGEKEKPFAYDKLVARALERRNIRAVAAEGAFFGSCSVCFGVPPKTKVAVIVPYLGDIDAVRKTLDSVSAGTFQNLTFYVPYGCIADARAKRYLAALMQEKAAEVLHLPGTEKPQGLKNEAARAASEELLLFADAGTELSSHDAVERMAAYALLPRAGAVGGKIVSPEGNLMHTGLVPGLSLLPGSLYYGQKENARAPLFDRYVNCVRNTTAVGGGALMCTRECFLAGRGFDGTVPACAADAELCIRLFRAGRRNIYVPDAKFCRKAESAPAPDQQERERLRDIFFPFMEKGDPMLSRNAQLLDAHWLRP